MEKAIKEVRLAEVRALEDAEKLDKQEGKT